MTLPTFDYISPERLDDALRWLSDHHDEPVRVLAGGTDLLVDLRRKVIPPNHRPASDELGPGRRWTTKPPASFRPKLTLLALSRISELRGISQTKDGVRIGAMTTIAELERSEVVRAILPGLWDGARQLGSPLVRARGTIGGNLCNARPAADTAIPTLALGGRLRLQSCQGERWVDLENFILAPGKTVVRKDELLTEIHFPADKLGGCDQNSASAYIKLANRKALEIAVVGAAAFVKIDPDRRVADAAVALGAVAPKPILVPGAAEALVGKALDRATISSAARAAGQTAKPITDHRGGRDYRRLMVEVLVRRALICCREALQTSEAAL